MIDVTKALLQDEDGTPKEMIERRNAERRENEGRRFGERRDAQRRKFYGVEHKHGLDRRCKAKAISEPQDEAPAYDDTGAPLLFDASTGTAPRGAYDDTEEAA